LKFYQIYIEGIEISIRASKRDRWHNLMEISMDGRTDLKQIRTGMTDKHTNTETLGVIHLKELKFPSRFGRNFHQIYKRDRWLNLMEISKYQTDGLHPSVRNQKKADRQDKHADGVIH
jgi:hypothetical protein